MQSLLSTDGLDSGDRFAWFCDVVTHDVAPMKLAARNPEGFRARSESVALGQTRLSSFAYTPIHSWRPPSLIRRSDPEFYHLALITAGSMRLTQRRNETTVEAGDWVLFDTSHPLESFVVGDANVSHVIIQLPRYSLRLPADRTDGLLARRLHSDSGLGAVLTGHVNTVAAHADAYTPQDAVHLGAVTRDLATAFLAHHLDAMGQLPRETRRQALLAEIDTFIDLNLADPALTPRAIADHHHISLRTLHYLFRQGERTVTATIRHRRLERCHRDLADPALASHSIADICAHWGFHRPTAFSRAFRAVYGLSPSDHRHHNTASAIRPPDPHGQFRAPGGPGVHGKP
ncbi:helix-turn-helix domain-containing protein [Streptomyces sp. CAU 1734]|uniref:AraC-like ligand-binding domain-containing protein n=1 Tax=Streptomyces sp. CAU 1734 TaxID=3140360 RepID=UPI0032617900